MRQAQEVLDGDLQPVQESEHMENFNDFCKWAGTQQRAAEMLGLSASQVSRMASGKSRVTPEIAERVELASHGLFKKERVLWPDNKAA